MAVASVVWHLSVTFRAVITVTKGDNDTIAMSFGVTAKTYDFVTATVDFDGVVTGSVVRLAPRTVSLPRSVAVLPNAFECGMLAPLSLTSHPVPMW